MQWVDNTIQKILSFLLSISIIVLTISTFLQVFSRFVFDLPLPWSTDVIRISFFYIIFISMPLLMSKKEHISIDILLSVLPKKVTKYLEIAILLFILFFAIVLCISGYQFMLNSGSQFMPYLRITMFYVYAVIPFSSLLVILSTILLLVKELKQLFLKTE
ncbi:TRAP transporter small permease [Bacillus sp. ISL-47]|uniref:TRAP transporter small permease n=1 Tax=Bacillus sp. ISL-47 TaxID=2819130 RepID=UPI001BEB7A6D|nr:TRAP transporter small permease [Bacillus sp. ISL-47]MBT2686800.1 TRAP transporter small permease [Bacillus sp. ISL-47]MBT2706847.1 TRAP transporter small permease [Pseudomonas sp. ISL-84]